MFGSLTSQIWLDFRYLFFTNGECDSEKIVKNSVSFFVGNQALFFALE